jgi:adenosylcobinamide kinase/adenosylcobinamide-phosphate guanylyltransferase
LGQKDNRVKDKRAALENKITLVIGGCRSGKSAWALEQADRIGKDNKVFIATSVPTDAEMQERVDLHQKERGGTWNTIEEPVLVHEVVNRISDTADVILVDCLTLWVSNLMLNPGETGSVEDAVDLLIKALEKSACPIFLVSNEVGLGIVPENALARRFRDMAGFVNRRVAQAANRVVMTVAGIAVPIKPGTAG